MNIPRIIPCLLLKADGLVKGVRFKNYKYVGDPLNAVKIFNDKEVDELIFLDITATAENRGPDLELIQRIADECYMPFGVGGGITSVEQIRRVLEQGAEKVVINSAAIKNQELIRDASKFFGNQSIVVSIDVKRTFFGKELVYSCSGKKKTKKTPVEWAKQIEALGAGEIIINSIDKDGTMLGYDIELIRRVSEEVNIPVIACGGAGKVEDFASAVYAGASACAAGSMFVFTGSLKAVLINYPSKEELQSELMPVNMDTKGVK